MRTYHLFISHSWRYGNQYDRLKNLLDKSRLSYRDYSVPRDDPIHNARSVRQLREAIKNQMRYASVVVVLAGVYASHSKWIDIEIGLAESSFASAKPIVAIKPRGKRANLDTGQKGRANRIVGWSTKSIVRAIKDLA